MKKALKRIVLALVTIILVLGVAASVVLIANQPLRSKVINIVQHFLTERPLNSIYYVNNVEKRYVGRAEFLNNDVREIELRSDSKYLINHSRGFALELPKDAKFDFSTAQEYITVNCSDMDVIISKEYSTYPEKEQTKDFIKDYLHKYMLNERYIEHNKITVHKDAIEKIGDYWVQMVALSRTPAPGSKVKYNTYVYCYIYTDSTMFYRLMFKAPEYNDELLEKVYRSLYSFDGNVPVVGISSTFTDFKPEIPDFWTDETKEFYNSLVNSDECKWGLYTPHAVVNNDFTNVDAIENKIGSKFDGLLEYRYYFEDMPVEGMKTAYENGKIIQLTVQTSTVMNEELDGYNPVFDILDGIYDERFKTMARQIKEVGHPVLFRLNNEMNSDWTSYGASACLDDPEIFVELWRKIYNIFKAEGVGNAIWVFNPNDQSFPPCGYNSTMAFYPGDEYVQMFGVTGYNTGTYYAELNGEKWKSFTEIYDNVMEHQYPIYKNFPWIITEFASSSIGGDKVKWINDMFENINKYPNIKMAFWFNSADYDNTKGFEKVVARPYWLDETPETTEAFANGLKN